VHSVQELIVGWRKYLAPGDWPSGEQIQGCPLASQPLPRLRMPHRLPRRDQPATTKFDRLFAMIPHVSFNMVEARMVTSRQGARSVSLGGCLQMARCLMSWSLLLVYRLKFLLLRQHLGLMMNWKTSSLQTRAWKPSRRTGTSLYHLFSMEPMGNFPTAQALAGTRA
jgi:hypothetical protein